MKRFTVLICSCIFIQLAHSQILIINDSLNLKKGIYKTFEEFRYNSPPIPLDYEIVYINENIANLKIDKEKTKFYGAVWGFCDGKNVYINRDFNMSGKRVLNPDSQFNKILFIGRYCYFLTYPDANVLVYRQYLPYAIDFNSGDELCLNCEPNFLFIKESQFKKIISRDPKLWQEYKNDKSGEDLFLKYIKIHSERYKDEILN